jgi:hypothetical protein
MLIYQILILLQAIAPGFLADIGIPDAWITSAPMVIVMVLIMLSVGFKTTSSLRTIIWTILIPQSRKAVTTIFRKEGRKRIYARLRNVDDPPDPYVSTQFVAALCYALVLTVPVLLWMALSRGIVLPVIRGLAVLLNRSQPAHPLRWAAFGLFLIGFHFDLLAS